MPELSVEPMVRPISMTFPLGKMRLMFPSLVSELTNIDPSAAHSTLSGSGIWAEAGDLVT